MASVDNTKRVDGFEFVQMLSKMTEEEKRDAYMFMQGIIAHKSMVKGDNTDGKTE